MQESFFFQSSEGLSYWNSTNLKFDLCASNELWILTASYSIYMALIFHLFAICHGLGFFICFAHDWWGRGYGKLYLLGDWGHCMCWKPRGGEKLCISNLAPWQCGLNILPIILRCLLACRIAHCTSVKRAPGICSPKPVLDVKVKSRKSLQCFLLMVWCVKRNLIWVLTL